MIVTCLGHAKFLLELDNGLRIVVYPFVEFQYLLAVLRYLLGVLRNLLAVLLNLSIVVSSERPVPGV